MVSRRFIGLAGAVAVLGGSLVGGARPASAAAGLTLDMTPAIAPPSSPTPPLPASLAAQASLTGGQAVAVTLTAMNGGLPVVGEAVDLALQHQDAAASVGSAMVGTTFLTGTGQPFITDGSGIINITYLAPNPKPLSGRDVIIATDVNTPTVFNRRTYDSSSVTNYTYPQTPIAPSGSLAPGVPHAFQITAFDGSPAPVPGAHIFISLTTSASKGGTAIATSAGAPPKALTATPAKFTADSSGQVTVTYYPSTSGGGVDTFLAENYVAFNQFEVVDTYTFCASSHAPLAGLYTTGGDAGLAAVASGATCVMAGGASGLQPPAPWQTVPFFGSVATLSGDVTGDGKTDLVAVNSNSTWVETSTGAALTSPAPWSSVPFYGSVTTLLADVNGDGKADLVAVDNDSTWVMLSNGSTFGPPTLWSTQPFYGSKATLAADVNHDGNTDLVAVNANSTWVMLSNGSTAFGPPVAWSTQPFYGSKATLAADVNHDGNTDLVAVNANSTWVMLSNGSTAFGPPVAWSSQPFYGSVATLAGDLNGDGKTDLIAVNGSSVWAMLSTGTAFGSPQLWASTST
jgi:hypothetical protein